MRFLSIAAALTLPMASIAQAGAAPAVPITTIPLISTLSVSGAGAGAIVIVNVGPQGNLNFSLRR